MQLKSNIVFLTFVSAFFANSCSESSSTNSQSKQTSSSSGTQGGKTVVQGSGDSSVVIVQPSQTGIGSQRLVKDAPLCAMLLGSCSLVSRDPSYMGSLKSPSNDFVLFNVAATGRMAVCQEISFMKYTVSCPPQISDFSIELSDAQMKCLQRGGQFSKSSKCSGISQGAELMMLLDGFYYRQSVQLNGLTSSELSFLKTGLNRPSADGLYTLEVCSLIDGIKNCSS